MFRSWNIRLSRIMQHLLGHADATAHVARKLPRWCRGVKIDQNGSRPVEHDVSLAHVTVNEAQPVQEAEPAEHALDDLDAETGDAEGAGSDW